MQEWSKTNPESRANQYATDLLLPVQLFKPATAKLRVINLAAASELAKEFHGPLLLRGSEGAPARANRPARQGRGIEVLLEYRSKLPAHGGCARAASDRIGGGENLFDGLAESQTRLVVWRRCG